MTRSVVRPIKTEAIEKATGASWADWCAFLDAEGAAEDAHAVIVEKAQTFKPVSAWWAQSVAVAYEQHIGRRKPGQGSDGQFAVSVTRTLPLPQQAAFDRWCGFADDLEAVDGRAILGPPTTSRTPKRFYWRCRFDDGSRASLAFERKGNEKTVARIEQTGIDEEPSTGLWKSAWSDLLNRCFAPTAGG